MTDWLIDDWLCCSDGWFLVFCQMVSGEETHEEIPPPGSFYNHYCGSYERSKHSFPYISINMLNTLHQLLLH